MENILNIRRKDLKWSCSSDHTCENESVFDTLFKLKWKMAENSDVLNYRVDDEILQTKILSGQYKIVTQFNPMRVKKRRPPAEMTCLKQSFDPCKFNFMQVKREEILFDLFVEECCWKKYEKNLSCSLLVNSAPISPFHGLLIPARESCKPQILDWDGLAIGLAAVLASHTPALKVGFNSLGGMATVNHYHMHAYYLPYPIYVETADCETLSGPLFVFKNHYAPGFIFQVTLEDIEGTARNVMRLIHFLLENEVCHNVMITRGVNCNRKEVRGEGEIYDTVRVCVWVRKSSFGFKLVDGFACALCEFGGHLPVYDEETWNRISEEEVVQAMRETCLEVYTNVLPNIKKLFS